MQVAGALDVAWERHIFDCVESEECEIQQNLMGAFNMVSGYIELNDQ
jgi:hypothetical protein